MSAYDPCLQLFSDRAPRLWFSDGTTAVTEGDLEVYEHNSILPREPWRLASPNEIRERHTGLLSSALERWEVGRSVSVLQIPGGFFDALEPLRIPSIQSVQQLDELKSRSDYTGVLQAAVAELWPLVTSPNGIEIFPMVFRNPGQRTSTFEEYRGRLVGLHLDACDAASFERRARARNRLCINLGRESRQFLYVDLPLHSMADRVQFSEKELAEPCPGGFSRLPDRLAYKFLRTYPDYPVTAIEVMPGEAYIAPTENILHDGSTARQTAPDITLTLLGYFAPAPVVERDAA